MTSGGNFSSKGKFFTVADAIVNIPSMKIARLYRKIRGSNLQQNKTETGNSRISRKLPQRFIRTQKPLPKGTRWSKRMLLWDSQPLIRVVLRQCREIKSNWRLIVCLPAMRLSNSQTRWYRGEEVGDANETAAGNQKKETVTVIPPTPIEN